MHKENKQQKIGSTPWQYRIKKINEKSLKYKKSEKELTFPREILRRRLQKKNQNPSGR